MIEIKLNEVHAQKLKHYAKKKIQNIKWVLENKSPKNPAALESATEFWTEVDKAIAE
mgnify:CR=1 FL=1